MHTIDHQVYSIVLRDWWKDVDEHLRPTYDLLKAAAAAIPFDLIAGGFFLYSIISYLKHAHMLDLYIVLTGIGCVLAALSLLFADTGILRKFQALATLLANAIFITVL